MEWAKKEERINQITAEELMRDPYEGTVSITNVEQLVLYDWCNKHGETKIPGKPPVWKSSSGPTQDEKVWFFQSAPSEYLLNVQTSKPIYNHDGSVFIDKPLDTLFGALYKENPSFSIPEIDCIANWKVLRDLSAWVEYWVDWRMRKTMTGPSFTFWIQLTKDTAIFHRQKSKGLGGKLKDKVLAPEEDHRKCKKEHHRIVSYWFAGMNMIIHHEIDAVVEDTAQSETTGGTTFEPLLYSSGEPDMVREGESEGTPLLAAFDLNGGKSKAVLHDASMLQMWITQVKMARRCGLLKLPTVIDESVEILQWQNRIGTKRDLQALRGVLKRIIDVVKDERLDAIGNFILECEKDTLHFYRADADRMLSRKWYSKWR